MVSDSGMPHAAGCTADTQSLILDSAISRCEKLWRVLELEGLIRAGREHPILALAAERWRAEREHLIAELQLNG
jgi:hypothetical protein